MKIFAVKENTKLWYYISAENISKMLNKQPYIISSNKRVALCPYCKNPVEIIISANASDGNTTSRIFSRHLKRSIENLADFNQDKFNACVLRKKNRAFVSDPTSDFQLQTRDINFKQLRKAISGYLGIYASDKLTYALLLEAMPKMRHLRNVDVFNFPFAILLLTHQIRLNGRIVFSRSLKRLINQSSTFFKVKDDTNQIVAKTTKGSDADLLFEIGKQHIEKSGLVYTELILKETKLGNSRIIGNHKIYVAMFDQLERKRL